jgi:hypothetical protein
VNIPLLDQEVGVNPEFLGLGFEKLAATSLTPKRCQPPGALESCGFCYNIWYENVDNGQNQEVQGERAHPLRDGI